MQILRPTKNLSLFKEMWLVQESPPHAHQEVNLDFLVDPRVVADLEDNYDKFKTN